MVEHSILLRCYTVTVDNWFLMFGRNVVALSSGV